MNLTKVSLIARRAIAITAMLLVAYTVFYFSKPVIIQIYKSIFPEKEEAKYVFGKIAPIAFESLEIGGSPEYVLNTKDGRLPNITEPLLNVYQMVKPNVSYAAGKRAQDNAAKLAFTDTQRISNLAGGKYKWVDSELFRELEINITANTLEYSASIVNNKDKFTPNTSFRGDLPENSAREILSNLGYLKDPLFSREGGIVTYGRLDNNKVIETTTPLDFTFAKKDWIRKVYDVPIYGPRFDDGLIEVVVASSSENKLKFTTIKAYEWEINTKQEEIGRYPSISVGEAWEAVTKGEGTIAKMKLGSASAFEPYQKPEVSKVQIEKVTLAYYDSPKFQPYMQPIYVFEGTFTSATGESGNAAIYYPALNPIALQTK